VGFGKAISKTFKSPSVFVFVGLIVGWAEPLVILGAEGVSEIPQRLGRFLPWSNDTGGSRLRQTPNPNYPPPPLPHDPH
jgi:hypothetical protein